MKFVVYGAGAIGGLIGANLVEAGRDVVLIARGDHGEAMRREGLLINAPNGSRRVGVEVAPTPAAAGIESGDVVLMAMKSQDTLPALWELQATATRATPIVCVQNGVENERIAQRLFPNVYGVCVMCPATHLEPGVIEASSHPIPGLLDIGRYPRGTDDTTRLVAGAFQAASFESIERPDIMRWKYCKLLLNVANAVEVVCSGPGLSQVRKRARQEAVDVLTSAGIAFASEEEDRDRRGDRISVQPVDGKERGGSSSWQSATRGTGSIETDYLNGEIVLLGRLHGIDTPINGLLQELAGDTARRRAQPGQWSAEEFLARIAET